MGNKVVFYSCGVGEVSSKSKELLESLAHQTFINLTLGERRSGELLVFTDYNEVVTKLVQIFRYPKDISPQWSLPYLDNLGTGIVMTVSVPVLVNGSFQGVCALDISMETLFQGVSYSQLADTSYSFLINREGRTLIHPLLPKPQTVSQGQLFIDISDLETDKAVESIIQSMKNGGNGNKRVNATRIIARGHVETEGVTNISMASSYYWTAVEGFQYSICIVSPEDNTREPSGVDVALDSFLYHRIDEHVPDNMQICQHFGMRAIKSNSAVQFSLTSWKDPLDHKKQVETKKFIEYLTTYMLTGDSKPLNNGFILKNGVRNEVAITSVVEKMWTNHTSYSDILVWRSIATRKHTRFYPATNINNDFDATKRPWFRRTLAARDKIILSPPYLDSWASNQVILTLSKAILKGGKKQGHSPTDPVAAVMECDFRLHYFGEKFKTFFPECFAEDCFIMETSGFLVWHPAFGKNIHSFNYSGIPSNHVIVVEPCVALSMIMDKIITSTKCMDVEKLQIRYHWRVHFAPDVTKKVNTLMKYKLYEIQETNLFVVTNYSKANKNCTCDKESDMCKKWKYTKYTENPYVTSLADFDPCENHLQYPSGNKYIPCTPHVTDNTRKIPRHDVVKDLPICFDPGCKNRKNKSECLNFPACEWKEKEALGREICVSFLDKDPENNVVSLLYSVSGSLCLIFVAVVCFLVMQKSCRKEETSKPSHHENTGFSQDSLTSHQVIYLSSSHPETAVKTRELSSTQPLCNINKPHVSYSTQKLLFTCSGSGLVPVEDSIEQSLPYSSVPRWLPHLHSSVPPSHKCPSSYSSRDSQSNSFESDVCTSEMVTLHRLPMFEYNSSLGTGSLPNYKEIE
ncbi:VWFA and cache domain-containing protein 1-like isoform X2 [Tachypleus tridentatus]